MKNLLLALTLFLGTFFTINAANADDAPPLSLSVRKYQLVLDAVFTSNEVDMFSNWIKGVYESPTDPLAMMVDIGADNNCRVLAVTVVSTLINNGEHTHTQLAQ